FVGPCMQLASSWTTPSSLGRPPSPTDMSFGSSSTTFTPAIAASSGSAPAATMSYAFLIGLPFGLSRYRPFAEQTTIGRRANSLGSRSPRSTIEIWGDASATAGTARLAATTAPAPRKSRRERDIRPPAKTVNGVQPWHYSTPWHGSPLSPGTGQDAPLPHTQGGA